MVVFVMASLGKSVLPNRYMAASRIVFTSVKLAAFLNCDVKSSFKSATAFLSVPLAFARMAHPGDPGVTAPSRIGLLVRMNSRKISHKTLHGASVRRLPDLQCERVTR